MNTFVFLGPSLPLADAEALLPAVYLAPIAMGDLYTLIKTRARPGDRVAIIDGFFEQVPAVWHKEILFALESGVSVYGASSMGALRAAETHIFGMRGFGRVFEAYRDGVIEDDDEVAVAHATQEEGYRSLSTAMVSIRFGLARLRDLGHLSAQEHDALCAYAKSQHYNTRSWADVYAYARQQSYDGAALDALRQMAGQPDVKAEDAMGLLRHLADDASHSEPPPAPEFVLEHTGVWRALVHSLEARVSAELLNAGLSPGALDSDVVAHLRASSPLREALLREASLMKAAMESRATTKPDSSELKAAVFRIAARNGLRTADEMAAWRAEQQIGDEGWKTLLDIDARVCQLTRNAMSSLDAYLLAASKIAGHYADARSNVAAIRRRHGEHWIRELDSQQHGIDYVELQRWYERRLGPMLPDPESHALALGFPSLASFVTELLASYLLARERMDATAG